MTTTLTTIPNLPDVLDRALYTDPKFTSDHSRNQYRSNLRAFETWRLEQGNPGLTKILVESYAAHLQRENLSAATINHKIACIRWWARKMVDYAFEYLPPEQAARVSEQAARVIAVEGVKGTSAPAGRHLAQRELVRLLKVCLKSGGPAGSRDAALFAVAWTTGLRRAELCRLRVEDLTITGEEEADLLVHGKGGKARPAYLFNGAFKALAAWLEVRGDAPGYIFPPITKGGVISPERKMSPEALRKLLIRRAERAHLKHLTWHDFRRTFAGTLLDKNDMATVQQLLGHASPTTTAAYDRRPETTRKLAIRGLHIPLPEIPS